MDGDSGGREGRCLFRYLSKLFQWANETSPMVRCWRQFGEPNDLGDHDFMSVAVLWRGAVAWFCEGSSCLMVRCTKKVWRDSTLYSAYQRTLAVKDLPDPVDWCPKLQLRTAQHSCAQPPLCPLQQLFGFHTGGALKFSDKPSNDTSVWILEKALHYLLLRQSLSGLPPLFQSTHPRNHGAHPSSPLEASAYWAQNLHRSHLSIPFSIAWQFSKFGVHQQPNREGKG